MNDGASKLNDGAGKIADGVQQLTDGSEELANGILKFDEEGIGKLEEIYNGDIKDLTERIQEVVDSGNAYESFGGKAQDVAGRVKFVIKTESVKAK